MQFRKCSTVKNASIPFRWCRTATFISPVPTPIRSPASYPPIWAAGMWSLYPPFSFGEFMELYRTVEPEVTGTIMNYLKFYADTYLDHQLPLRITIIRPQYTNSRKDSLN